MTYTINRAAAYLNTSTQFVKQLIQDSKLPCLYGKIQGKALHEYKAKARLERRKLLAEMVAESQLLDMY